MTTNDTRPKATRPDKSLAVEIRAALSAMRSFCRVAICAVLAGCAVPTTGIVPLSDGLLKVTHQGNGFWVATANLKTEAAKEAGVYCQQIGRQARVIDVKENQAKPMGGWPEVEVLFKCD
nr:hypothetical protein [Variovorax boronicumulans]